MKEKFILEIIEGANGQRGVYLNGYRIAGVKPPPVGRRTSAWIGSVKDIDQALKLDASEDIEELLK